MKLLLDECTPKRLTRDFPGHEVFAVNDVGLKGIENGELLRAAVNAGFDVLITVDRKIPSQQNLAQLPLAVLICWSRTPAGIPNQSCSCRKLWKLSMRSRRATLSRFNNAARDRKSSHSKP